MLPKAEVPTGGQYGRPTAFILPFIPLAAVKRTLWIYERQSAKLRQVSDAIVRPLGSQVVRWTGDSKKVIIKIAFEDFTAQENRQAHVVSQEAFKGQTEEPGSAVHYLPFIAAAEE